MTEDLDLKQKLDFIASHGLLFNTKAELANRVGFGNMTKRGGQSLGSIADKERTFERLAAYASHETNEFVVLSRDVEEYMKAEEFFKRYKSQLSNEDTLLALLNLVFGPNDVQVEVKPKVGQLYDIIYDAEIDVPMLLLMHFDILPVKSRQNDIEEKELKARYRQVTALLGRLKDEYSLPDDGIHKRLYAPFAEESRTFTRLQAFYLVWATMQQTRIMANPDKMSDDTRNNLKCVETHLLDGTWSTDSTGQTTDFLYVRNPFVWHYAKKEGRWTVCRYEIYLLPYCTKVLDGQRLSRITQRDRLFQLSLLSMDFLSECVSQGVQVDMQQYRQIVIAQADSKEDPTCLEFKQSEGQTFLPTHMLHKNTGILAAQLAEAQRKAAYEGTSYFSLPSLAAITHDYIYVGIVNGETLFGVEFYMYDMEELHHCLYREYFKIPRQTVEGLEDVRMDDGIGIGVYRTEDGQRKSFIYFVNILHCIDADNEELLSRLGITRVTLPEDYGDGMFADDYLAHVSAQYVVTD